ncbi:diversity-generating retroelement protein Avd [Aminobacterium sp. UBA5514]|uniref:diversity-generating retroelement protein Avd n=1 Tax=Aminobacterium sp. UBA5514 TaxID=1946036 RepID=UPI00257CABA3|nr:diversity-generating retroelement protein Avd [Aminobacterium sp. UBA5514]
MAVSQRFRILNTEHLNPEFSAIAENKRYKSLFLQEKLRQLAAYQRIIMRQFPRVERHSLCDDIRHTTRELQRLVCRCKKRYYKKTTLEDMDIELDLLRELVMESYESKYINAHRFEVWSKHVNEIGKMIGGWIQSIKNKK